MTKLNSVKEFLAQKHLALAGISRTKSKFGNTIFKELTAKGYMLYPIHHELKEYEGVSCYPDVKSLPENVSGIIICTKPDQAKGLVEEAISNGIRHIWLQQGAQRKDVVDLVKDRDVNLIAKECVLMFAEPTAFFHRFHRSINKFVGKYPK
nr:CoA-binding protein [Bacteroidota bacterium]